ncbi:hypothetical protein L6269_00775, partial [Candidatus Dependentiae bacterium]|nr:hypothetical protein [Candidatus Dependentiae bacterium]
PENLDIYALAHRREAHKAFLKHGTDTQPLTALIFNKADFPLNQIFPNSQVNPAGEFYNPFMDLMTIKPRATYYEWGMNLGARLEYPVYKNRGRIGLRMNIPFRSIEMEREDITSQVDDPTQDYILTRVTKVGNFVAGPKYENSVDVYAKAYNINFISKLFQDPSRNPALQFANQSVKVFGVEIAKDFNTNEGQFLSTIKPVAGVIFNESGKTVPNEPNFTDALWGYVAANAAGIAIGNDIASGANGGYGARAGSGTSPLSVDKRYNWAFDAGDDVKKAADSLKSRQITNNFSAPLAAVPATEIMNAPNIAFFSNDNDTITNVDYSSWMDAGYPTLMPEELEKSWLVLGYNNGNLVPGAKTIADAIDNAVALYDEDPYEWLLNKGDYEFETQTRTGLGDIDLDLFYEHIFSDEWIAELMVGVRFPTGSGDDYTENPYKAHLGNGEHFEIKLGGMGAWKPLDWMNLKLDTYVSFVLEGNEKRCAAFEGAQIKNMGPRVDADVDWTYFVLRLDSTLFHPKTNDISATVGYEFYYKTKDNIHFKDRTITPWYGDKTDGTSLAATINSGLAEKNTESIAHKLRGEVRIQINEWFELVGGGAFTFAGQNIQRELDAHGGFSVRF